jgi:hypothetical protein
MIATRGVLQVTPEIGNDYEMFRIVVNQFEGKMNGTGENLDERKGDVKKKLA